MNYLSQRPLGQAAMDPAMLEQVKVSILAEAKAGDYGPAIDRYNALSPDDKYAVLMYLKAARDRGEISAEAVEMVAEGRPFLAMTPMVIKSWLERNKLLVGGLLLAGGAYWYFSKKPKRRKKASS
jgi:hypothetical protein